MNLAAALVAATDRRGGATAVRLGTDEWSYHALDGASARLAGLVTARSAQPGTRVGVMLPAVPEFAIAYYGVLRSGGVVVALDVRLAEDDVASRLRHARATLLFAWHALAELAEPAATAAGCQCVFVTPDEFRRLLARAKPRRELAERDDADEALVRDEQSLSHGELLAEARAATRAYSLGDDDVTLSTLPLERASALDATVLSGSSLSLPVGRGAEAALRTIARDRVAVLHAPSSLYPELLARAGGHDVSSLRLATSWGEPLPSDLVASLEAELGCDLLDRSPSEAQR